MKTSRSPTSSPPTKLQNDPPEELQEQIRQRAYELYYERGAEDGHDLDDWLQAETEVRQKNRALAA